MRTTFILSHWNNFKSPAFYIKQSWYSISVNDSQSIIQNVYRELKYRLTNYMMAWRIHHSFQVTCTIPVWKSMRESFGTNNVATLELEPTTSDLEFLSSAVLVGQADDHKHYC